MKDSLRISLLISAMIFISAILGLSMVLSARIIGESIKASQDAASDKILSELALLKKTINDATAPAGTGQAVNAPPPAGSKRVEGVLAGANPIKGNAGAPVLMVEFSDFQCPFSKRFYNDIFPDIEREYISTGKVKFAYRDFPLGFHDLAKPAAIAARCAGKQDKYWQMADKLILNDSLQKDAIKTYASELGLDLKAFEECQADPLIKEAVDADIKDAGKFGIEGTPSFFINGRLVIGVYPFEEFKRIIEEELRGDTNKDPQSGSAVDVFFPSP
ncbi:MAG: DsbA family protein [Candidatus Omnitrophica bacterium]|nr:DsbA family protein [Candidatus Omnitrophota bacterium]MDD5552625.1 DsbA family protein [Candidatus Omnitrophota bacterium]